MIDSKVKVDGCFLMLKQLTCLYLACMHINVAQVAQCVVMPTHCDIVQKRRYCNTYHSTAFSL